VPGRPESSEPVLSSIERGQPSLREAALAGLCPRCGAKTLFEGPIKFAAHCRACGLDFSKFNVGDGPAAFLTMIVGAVIVALALTLQLAVEPPWWVHVLLWVPLTTLGVIGGLRLALGALLWSDSRPPAGAAGRPSPPAFPSSPRLSSSPPSSRWSGSACGNCSARNGRKA
jgi:uncharacterized protein (DUF983 family)